MSQIDELAAEIASVMEIFCLGRATQNYNNTTFILCDDYTELASKLFLKLDNPQYTHTDARRTAKYDTALANVLAAASSNTIPAPADTAVVAQGRPVSSFKPYATVLGEVRGVFNQKYPQKVAAVTDLHKEMEGRRTTRNNLFHSTEPLGMQASSPVCIQALCGLLQYMELLFPRDWPLALRGARRLETYRAMLFIQRKALSNPIAEIRLNDIFARRPRYQHSSRTTGVQTVFHANDVHKHLCIQYDANETLKVALETLLSSL